MHLVSLSGTTSASPKIQSYAISTYLLSIHILYILCIFCNYTNTSTNQHAKEKRVCNRTVDGNIHACTRILPSSTTTCVHVWGRLQDGEEGWQHRQNSLQRSAHELACLTSLHRRPGSRFHGQDEPRGDKLICFTQSKWPFFSYSHWQMQPPPLVTQAALWLFGEEMTERNDLVVFSSITGSLG